MFVCVFVCLIMQKVKSIMDAVTIPVMAKCRIGHFAEAQILQHLGADFIDESEGYEQICVILGGGGVKKGLR